jgi:polyisoprenoid-binding protein YceI
MNKLLTIVVLVAVLGVGFATYKFATNPTKEDYTPTKNEPLPDVSKNTTNDNTYEGATQYFIDTTRSTLSWSSERIVGSSHKGTVSISDGMMFKKDNAFNGGIFTIDMTTIEESLDNQKFIGHIKSADFFEVDKFPTATLVVTDLILEDNEEYKIQADLVIKDISNPITFNAIIKEETENEITASANLEIDRTLWDITFDSGSIFQQLGDKAIKDEIEFTINLFLVKES